MKMRCGTSHKGLALFPQSLISRSSKDLIRVELQFCGLEFLD